MKLKFAAATAMSLSLLFSCGMGDEAPGADEPNEITESSAQALTISCSGDYHPVAWCSGAVAKVKCQSDYNTTYYGYRAVNCANYDMLCRDYGSTVNCVKP